MSIKRNHITLLVLLVTVPVIAQRDSITLLNTVELSDSKLKAFSKGYKTKTLTDSVVTTNSGSFADLIKTNSTLFLTEYGVGGTSSVSYRGTSASQTAVVWNGININSQLNGQTDFNTISVRNYDNITIRSGGGSVPYGSGAIGGSIHLNSNFSFKKHHTQRLLASLGSFVTANTNYRTSYGTKKLNLTFGLEHRTSKNDHLYLGTRQKRNENGEFQNLNLNLNFGYYLNKKNLFTFFQNYYIGERNFSGTALTPSDDSYEDKNNRTLLKWRYHGKRFASTTSAAFIYEEYRYFPNPESTFFNFGKANNLLLNYDFDYTFTDRIRLKTILSHQYITGKGSNIIPKTRNISGASLLFSHQITNKFNYSVQLKQEFTTNYKPPLVYALDLNHTFSKYYSLKINASKNFRIPTYNDLYWGGQGNPDLRPETSQQAEIINEFNYKGLQFNVTAFFIQTKDLLQWQPGISGVWRPNNVRGTDNYGLELGLNYAKAWQKSSLSIQTDYAYTIAENQETKKQLIYTPKQKAVATVAYKNRKVSMFYQFLWNGQFFITGDNTQGLPKYDVSNIGMDYHFSIKRAQECAFGFRINNIYNEIYQLRAARPAANRNFQLQLTLYF